MADGSTFFRMLEPAEAKSPHIFNQCFLCCKSMEQSTEKNPQKNLPNPAATIKEEQVRQLPTHRRPEMTPLKQEDIGKLKSHPRLPSKTEFNNKWAQRIAPYKTISPVMQQQLDQCQNWGEVVELHKKYHPVYDTTLINHFLRNYNQQAIKLKEQGLLRPNLEFMTELD